MWHPSHPDPPPPTGAPPPCPTAQSPKAGTTYREGQTHAKSAAVAKPTYREAAVRRHDPREVHVPGHS